MCWTRYGRWDHFQSRKNWTGCSPGQMICRMNSGRKIKDKLSHLINRWLFLKKQGTDDYLLTNKYATNDVRNPLFSGFSSYQSVNKEIIQENITKCTEPRKHCVFGVFLCVSAKSQRRRICHLRGEGGERRSLSQALILHMAEGNSPWP